MTRRLADVASGRAPADLVITGARVLSTYSERIAPEREIWIAGGRIAAVKPAGAYKQVKGAPGGSMTRRAASSRRVWSIRISISRAA